MRKNLFTKLLFTVFAFALLPGLSLAQKKEKDPAAQRAEVHADVMKMIETYKKTDPGIDRFLKNSAGYAVFPRVGKAGFIVGGGAGDGEVFEKGKLVGSVSVGFATVGLQIGVQEFSEILFFENQAALDRFKQNKFEFTGGVSLVIVKAGGADSANYRDGVVVFARPTGGAMAEAAVGTQKFTYKPDAK